MGWRFATLLALYALYPFLLRVGARNAARHALKPQHRIHH